MSELFDKMASRYDSPSRMAVAAIITTQVKEIIKHDDLSGTFLDFGCGTGLIGLELAPKFDQLYLTDTSTNMLAIVAEKLEKRAIKNAAPILWEAEMDLPQTVDVILVSQVLLHIPETKVVLTKLFSMLNPGGRLLIVDFDKNETIKTDKIHPGFVQTDLRLLLTEIGFRQVSSKTFHHQEELLMNQAASLFWLKAVKA